MTSEFSQDPNAQSAPIESPDDHENHPLAVELATANAELVQLRMDSLRERADLDNQRKRLTRDVEMARKFANERLLSALLPVIDSLEAGLQAAGSDAVALREGVELTLRQLLKVTGENGLVEVNPVGLPFNPEHHQAMSTVSSADHAPGDVVQVYQKGWLLNERLLRPALVVVNGDA